MRIALATDATGSDTLAARHAVALAARAGASLITIHVDPGEDVVDDLIVRLQQVQPSLIVLGTHARHGIAALLHESVAEAVARNVGLPTLIVPNHARPFIDENGGPRVTRVLVPALDQDDARRATTAVRMVLELLGATDVPIEVTRQPLASLLETSARDASLIAMSSHGHDGLGDILHGSHTEQVVRDAGCAVLCVPA